MILAQVPHTDGAFEIDKPCNSLLPTARLSGGAQPGLSADAILP